MYKPKSLRKALTDAVPDLARNPEMMRIFIDNGKLASTLAASLSFENQYTLNVVVTDFTGDIELLLVPIQAWLRIHQADIMTTDEGRKKGFTYFADINSNDSADISISLMLTERTLVREDGGKLHIETVPEPQPPEPLV
ncbi:phage tail protein [Escherichia coli]|uniref:phage tail protein n=1 Tax=Escherichia coli TaxID=562 RepID=UPI001BD589F1|nr:phage tail protein [Escherichia coli]